MEAESCLTNDISRGAELRPIPVYGRPADAKALEDLLRELVYIGSSFLETKAAKKCVAACQSRRCWGGRCGIEAMGCPHVRLDHKLARTRQLGLLEYASDAKQRQNAGVQYTGELENGPTRCGQSCHAAKCKANRVLSRGITLPLEIFRTESCGWGVRCTTAVSVGAFVCEYAGAVCTASEADSRPQDYLFDLDHFLLLQDCKLDTIGNDPPQPPAPDWEDLPDHLTIDASRFGNVGRFLNHSCEGNVLVQPVLIAGSSGLFYKIGLFAKRDIAARDELTYNYKWTPNGQADPGLWCGCGSLTCQGRLL